MDSFIETTNLIIRPPQLEDLSNLYQLQTDPEVMKYIGSGVRTLREITIGLEKAIAHQQKHKFSLGSVFEKENGLFVGRAGLIYVAYDDTQPNIEVAYALTKSAWGKGYGVELATAIIDWGFHNLPVNKLFALVNPENDYSRRVVEKAQMTYVKCVYYGKDEVALYAIEKPSNV